MALPIPTLDDRTYAALLETARDGIPVQAEAWTDHNVHDPGITILELLAWVTEAELYRLDRVPDEHRRKFLQLLGFDTRPPEPATATLMATLPPEANSGVLPSGTTVVAEASDTESQYFETTASRTLTQATLQRVITDDRTTRSDKTSANDTTGLSFHPFGRDANPGSALYLGFGGDPFAGVSTLDLTVSFHEADVPAPARHGDDPVEFTPTVELRWEHCTAPAEWYREASWAPVPVRSDSTERFYQSGTVRLERPADWAETPASESDRVLDQDRELFWLRCVVTEADHYELPPQFDSIRCNVVPVRHGNEIRNEPLVREDGGDRTTAEAGQVFTLGNAPVLASEPEPDIDLVVGPGDPVGALDVTWTQVVDFAASGPDDLHFVLDRATGTVTFGDGHQGVIPAPEQLVTAKRYRWGGGQAGNVDTSARWRVIDGITQTTGAYRYRSTNAPEGMRGAVLVGDRSAPLDADVAEWLAPATGETIPVDRRGESSVTITMDIDDVTGSPQFSPAAVWIDPGTIVRFEAQVGGHTIEVVAQPPDAEWQGVPEPLGEGAVATYTFDGPLETGSVAFSPIGRATGGRDAEVLDDAFRRLEADRRTVYRAVTAADHATLATKTPGLRFGRATAYLEVEAASGDCPPTGVITVIVVPFSTRNRPVPSEGFLEAVRCHLERHRLVTAQVAVKPPSYVGVGVDVEVRLAAGQSQLDRQTAIETRLREYLNPLHGFEGAGWPFGRPVYRSELFAVVEEVPGVECVVDLALRTDASEATIVDGAVEIGQRALVYSLDHDVTVRAQREGCGVGGNR